MKEKREVKLEVSKRILLIFILVFVISCMSVVFAENITVGGEISENITWEVNGEEIEEASEVNVILPEENISEETNITYPEENITEIIENEVNETKEIEEEQIEDETEKKQKGDLGIEKNLNISGNMPAMKTKTFGLSDSLTSRIAELFIQGRDFTGRITGGGLAGDYIKFITLNMTGMEVIKSIIIHTITINNIMQQDDGKISVDGEFSATLSLTEDAPIENDNKIGIKTTALTSNLDAPNERINSNGGINITDSSRISTSIAISKKNGDTIPTSNKYENIISSSNIESTKGVGKATDRIHEKLILTRNIKKD